MTVEKYKIDRKYLVSAYIFDLYRSGEWLGEFVMVDDIIYKKDSFGTLIKYETNDTQDILNLINLT